MHLNVCACVCCGVSAAAHLRGPGEPAHKPADYLRALQGLLSRPHKLPQLNASYSLFLSFFPLFPSSCYAFISHPCTPPVLSQRSRFTRPPLFSLHRFFSSLSLFSSCQPAASLQLSAFPSFDGQFRRVKPGQIQQVRSFNLVEQDEKSEDAQLSVCLLAVQNKHFEVLWEKQFV